MPAAARDFQFDRVSQIIGTDSLAEQVLHTFRFDLVEKLPKPACTCFGNIGLRNRALVHVANIRNRRAERAEHRAEREDQRGFKPRFLGDSRSEKAAVPAVRKERVMRQILLQFRLRARNQVRDGFKRAVDNHPARRFRRETQRLRYQRLDRLPRKVAIDRLRPAQKIIRIDQARRDECVREGRLVSAQAVARGPGKGAHAFGAELHFRAFRASKRLDDAAAPERDRTQIGQRELERIAEEVRGLAIDGFAVRRER